MDDRPNLIWLDLEMTGLDPINDRIIEMAVIVTDNDLNILDQSGLNIVTSLTEEQVDSMLPEVHKMLSENGLIAEALRSTISSKEGEEMIVEYLSKYTEKRGSPLCGNSTGTDRAFMMAQLHLLEEFIHYRNIDVSSFKQLVNFYLPQKSYKKPKGEHRGLDDIRASINEMRYYKELLFSRGTN